MTLTKKTFLSDNFLLDTKIAERLYFEYAEALPIIDYHNHLPPDQICNDINFENLTQIWLNGDHYKWRAMRTLGVDEKYITGDASDWDKFLQWSKTVPNTLRNPLYHWTHMELKRPFGITELLNEGSAKAIYDQTSAQLKTKEFSVRGILGKMNVEVVCTTDDPLDDLAFHHKMKEQDTNVSMLPAWRPDKAMAVDNQEAFLNYTSELEKVTNTHIHDLESYMGALQERHDFFHERGCRLSDHGLNQIVCVPYTQNEVDSAFGNLLGGKPISEGQKAQLASYFLIEFAKMDHAKGWVQQFHLGALRNNNKRMLRELGPDTGFDSIGDFQQASALSLFLDTLDDTDQLAKTIVYNLNPSDNEVFATMMGNFNSGGVRGKMQYGSGWWFLDQLDGMEKQINTLSNMGLLSCFVGMLTDSRSFLSFPRHEYFRRLLCNIIANDMDKGKIPEDYALVGKMIQNICYYNAKEYFNFNKEN